MEAEVIDDVDVRLSWEPGRDKETKEEQLVYLIYLGEGDLPVSLEKPFATSLPGATSHDIQGLPPGKFRFVVRAVDRDGNTDTNKASVRASLGDEESPTFAGVTGAIPRSATEVLVEWKPALDNRSRQEFIRYQVFIGDRRRNLFDGQPLITSPGATSFLATVEGGSDVIHVGVRAIDEAGNVDDNERITTTEGLENEAPSFGGLSSASPSGDGVLLRWSPATDNATASAELVYRIYVAEQSGGHDFSRPDAITEPGRSQFWVGDLRPDREYFFIVQAQDLAGNRDRNTVQRATTTAPRDRTPPEFAGVTAAGEATPESLSFSWSPAADARSATDAIVYELYLHEKSGRQNFDAASAVSSPGRTSAVVFGLEPETEYFAVVRARDEWGNLDDNEVELSATTTTKNSDRRAPELKTDGLRVRTALSEPTWLEVSWDGATDNRGGPLRGHVCVSEDASDCDGDEFFENRNITSLFGNNSIFVTNLAARTEYWVSVRLEDQNGNIMSAGVLDSGVTATSYSENVEPLLESRCNQCHEDHNFSYGTIVNVPSGYESLYLIDSASARNSYLIRSLREPGDTSAPFSEEAPADHGTVRMPSDGTEYLTVDQESILLDWLNQGAFLN